MLFEISLSLPLVFAIVASFNENLIYILYTINKIG